MSHYSDLDAIKSSFDKPDIWFAEIISLWPSTAEIKSAEINSVNFVAKSQKFIPAEITRYTVQIFFTYFAICPQFLILKVYGELTDRWIDEPLWVIIIAQCHMSLWIIFTKMLDSMLIDQNFDALHSTPDLSVVWPPLCRPYISPAGFCVVPWSYINQQHSPLMDLVQLLILLSPDLLFVVLTSLQLDSVSRLHLRHLCLNPLVFFISRHQPISKLLSYYVRHPVSLSVHLVCQLKWVKSNPMLSLIMLYKFTSCNERKLFYD